MPGWHGVGNAQASLCHEGRAIVRGSLGHMHSPPESPISFEVGDEEGELILPGLPDLEVCPGCRGVINGPYAHCRNCRENAATLDGIVQEVVPISLYAKPSRLRDWLTFYKSAEETPQDPQALRAVGHILGRFLIENVAWLTALQPEAIVVVPSTMRPPPHPLSMVIETLRVVDVPVVPLLARTALPLGHNAPHRQAFRLAEGREAPARVLLVDDVYTSGARGQSAAYALREAGISVVGFCVIGRRYNPEWTPQAREVFERQKSAAFEWDIRARLATRTSPT